MLENPAGLNPLTEKIIGAGIAHRVFGPGLLEAVYRSCLVLELKAKGLRVETERSIPLVYRGVEVGHPYKVDLIVEGQVVVEAKAEHALAPVHEAQVITYLKLTGCPVGLLMNFNVPMLKDGVSRVVLPGYSPTEG
jgi:GxxExxY protein